jgi:nicotinamidase/pyrazinamidase
VKAAVLGLRERGYRTVLIDDAARGITREGTAAALDAMRASGARIASSNELLSSAAG